MIIDENWPSAFPCQPGLYNEKFLPGLRKLVEAVHEEGSKIFLQPWHPGQVAYTPGKVPKTINELTLEEINHLLDCYAMAAKMVKASGADGIEYQMCHNYLGSQFLSTYYNKRNGAYGTGSLENRMRFSKEVINRIRQEAGEDFPISIKLNAMDFVDGGITVDLAAEVATILESYNVSMISVSAGGTDTMITGMSAGGEQPEGWKVPFASEIKAKVKGVPIAATDSIRHPDYARKILEDGLCDIVGIGRGVLAEHDWVKKIINDREDEMRYCVSCHYCFDYCEPGKSGCTVNPFALREYEQPEINKNGNGRKVVVVGAGPAGLEAAVTLAERGFSVKIYEQGNSIGGMINLAKVTPDKGKLEWIIDYYKAQIKRLNILVNLKTSATKELLIEEKPYAVVIATGTKEKMLLVEGCNEGQIQPLRKVLEEKPALQNKNILIVGAGMAGIEVAEMYLEDNNVTVIDALPPVDTSTLPYDHQILLGKVNMKGMKILMGKELVNIDGCKAIIADIAANQKEEISADHIILSVGVYPDNVLFQDTEKEFEKIYCIGDSNNPGKIAHAVQAGSQIGYELN